MQTGELIKRARTVAGLTQAELAKRLGVTPQAISQYERGIKNPKNETLKRIATALDIPWCKLLSDDPKEQLDIILSDQDQKLARLDKIRDERDALLHEMSVDWSKERFNSKDNAAALAAYRSIKGYLDLLNSDGLTKAEERVHELTEIPRYKRKDTPEE